MAMSGERTILTFLGILAGMAVAVGIEASRWGWHDHRHLGIYLLLDIGAAILGALVGMGASS